MKISYNWLKQYLNFNLSPEETGKLLTNCGLEVEGIEIFESVKGGLRGLVVGEVLTCEPHPDSDHLHVTTVNVGNDKILDIVCGAPNVAAGQKVIVATIGTVLYNEEDSFTIKKSKIRGCVSEGMICAEDEIGVGSSHDGIMVLEASAQVGTPAKDYFNILCDSIFEIGLTPNRSDAISHLGVARDLYAMLRINNIPCSQILYPVVTDFIPTSKKNKIDINIQNKVACPRYTGLCFENIVVKESPKWLKNCLLSIGIRPINNIVDITQFVMFECGQPLHAFDSDKIKGNKVIIKNLPTGTPFKTLDGNTLELNEEDLMICNAESGMCIAGVYGGLDSGINEHTKNIFLESAYFQATSVRKTSKRHSLKTDAAFRFERGCDPNITVYAIKRAANLFQEYANATVASEIIDVYPSKIEPKTISLTFEEIYKIAGKEIEPQTISNILLNLGFELISTGKELLLVRVPLNKVDVLRPIDLIEEILRIYGYNNIEINNRISYTPNQIPNLNFRQTKREISLFLAHNGCIEIMNNSLSKESYADLFEILRKEEQIKILNPLSSELNVMRQTLLFGGLETIARNLNNRNNNLRLFEFGKIYLKSQETGENKTVTDKYREKEKLSIWISGKNHDDIWNESGKEMDFFYLKNLALNIIESLNISQNTLQPQISESKIMINNISYLVDGKELVQIGELRTSLLKAFDIKKTVFYAEFDAEMLHNLANKKVEYSTLPVFPAVKRDLSLVVNENISYKMLEDIAFKYGGSRLKSVSLFDVYTGNKLESGKKSYALNFVLQHPDKTLTEEEISKTMSKLIAAFERECNAKLR